MTSAVGASELAGATHRASGDLNFYEQERRFLLTRAQAVDFLAAVGPHVTVELYDQQRPVAYTRTTYFDTNDLAYFHSCAGPVARRLRVREYAFAADLAQPPVLSGVCFLELKQNSGDTRTKVRLEAPPDLINRLIEGSGAPAALNGEANGAGGDEAFAPAPQMVAWRALADELRQHRVLPRIATWYRRVSLRGETAGVRITLDDGLTFVRPQPLGRPGDLALPSTEVIASGPARILEVKFAGEPPAWLQAATDGLAATPHFSKFRLGMTALQQQEQLQLMKTTTTTTTTTTARDGGLSRGLFSLDGHGSDR